MFFPKLGTGFRLIDNLWQGFFKGRTYLVTGPADSGKTTFCLQFALPSLATKEKVIFFTDERPDDLLLRAEGLQLDFFSSLENGNFIIFNFGLEDKSDKISDELINKTINEIIQIVEKEQPTRLIFDQFTFLLQFKELETLKRNIKQFIYSCEKFKATTLITVGEPASTEARNILNFLSSLATATLKLSQAEQEERRIISLNARLGHYPVSYAGSFLIQPGVGFKEFESEKGMPPPASSKMATEISPEQESKLTISQELIGSEEKPVETLVQKPSSTPDSKLIEESEIIEPIESIPEYPIRDLDRDDFTGLFNFDGLLNLIARAIEKKTNFSLMIVRMVKGVESQAKRLLLSHDLASAVKSALNKPVPIGRYSDKIIVYLHRTNKPESENMAQAVEEKALATLIAENETLKNLEIKADVYSDPDDIQTIHEVEAIVQAGSGE